MVLVRKGRVRNSPELRVKRGREEGNWVQVRNFLMARTEGEEGPRGRKLGAGKELSHGPHRAGVSASGSYSYDTGGTIGVGL